MTFTHNLRTALLAACALTAPLLHGQNTDGALRNEIQEIRIETDRTSLLLEAPANGTLRTIYYGSRLDPAETARTLRQAGTALDETTYPAFGQEAGREEAISMVHANGAQTLDLRVAEATQASGQEATVTLRDAVYPVEVKIFYKAYPESDLIETWTEISHEEKKPVTLRRFASGCLPMRRGDVWAAHLHGAWGDEAGLTMEPLTEGMKVIKNRNGVRNSAEDHAEMMFGLDGRPQENEGRTIGVALCWSGNYALRVETGSARMHQLIAGINEDNSEYRLEKGEVFRTPALALTYSTEGMSGVSRNFHRWALQEGKIHGADTPRDVLLNSWEGVYCYIKEPEMHTMIRDFADLGGELFVMDDGWFGTGKYQRNNDTDALGDWDRVDTLKLPHGIQALADTAARYGLKFGLWIEPEMTNTRSYLYEEHPDWIVCPPEREPIPGRGRTQLVLDLSNPEVQDFVVGVVDHIAEQYPGVSYIKWDANMDLQQYGSHYLTGDRQSHLYIDYHRGLEKALQRIRQRHPDLVMQACASGGGRANYGVMPYFDEFWTSDNTDALQRIYIQWGTSMFFPPQAMACHVSASPNHQTGRRLPLKFRFDVAMSGRLGMEMQPKTFTPEEKEYARRALADYKEIRPLVQQGEIYRLISPYEGKGVASLMYTNREKTQAVVYVYKMDHFVNQTLPLVRLEGLDTGRRYRIRELSVSGKPCRLDGLALGGGALKDQGLDIPLNGEYASRVFLLTAE